MINTKIKEDIQSNADLQDIFSTIMDTSLARHQHTMTLKAAQIETVLGPMIAIADELSLYLLEFVTRRGLEKEIRRLRANGFSIISGKTVPIQLITAELADYFSGALTVFKTPYRVFGSQFQQSVWQALEKIPYGETKSYKEQSMALGHPKAYRAVANANGANQLAIIIPCHRIIASDGSLGGYGGGLAIKRWLLEHEKQFVSSAPRH